MVVCSTPLMPVASSTVPLPPPPIHPLCAMNPMSGVPCNQPLPPSTIITTSPTLLGTAVAQTVPGLLRYAQTVSNRSSPNCSPPPNSCDIGTTNGTTVLTYTPIPSNFVPITTSYQIVPYKNEPDPCKLSPVRTVSSIGPCNPAARTVSRIVPCNPAVYTCNPAIVPCQQRLVNGTSVLQCTPGVCPLARTAVYPNGTVEICSVPPAPAIPRNQAVIPVTSPSLPSMTSMAQTVCTTTATAWKQSYGMEQVWQSEFRTLFLQYSPHHWTLLPVSRQPPGIWHTNVDSAKVRFRCEEKNCGNAWTSMKGRVAFWFILNPASTEGVVCLKLYGQQCDRCKTGNYEPAMWYPEEVLKVMVNIYNKVGQVYYGFQQAPYHKTRRPGKPRTPHNSNLCQACKDGVCAERR